jgi:hypothetical protein
VRLEGAGHVCRTSAHEDRDLTPEVLSLQVVIVQFGNREAIAHEHRLGLHLFGRLRGDDKRSIFAQLDGLRLTVSDELERAPGRIDLVDLEVHRLAVALNARGP